MIVKFYTYVAASTLFNPKLWIQCIISLWPIRLTGTPLVITSAAPWLITAAKTLLCIILRPMSP